MSFTKEDFDRRFFDLFNDDYLIDAYQLYKQAMREIEALSEVQILKDDLTYGDSCLEVLADLDNWQRVRDEGNIVTYCKGSGDSFMVATEMILEQPIFPILALFTEVDLLPNLCDCHSVPNLKEARCIYEPSKFRKLVRYIYEFPWPVSDREIVLECAGFPVAQTKSALLTIKSPTRQTLLGFPVPPPSDSHVRCDVPMGCINLMILEPMLTQLSIVLQVNPRFVRLTQPLLPTSVINFVCKHAAYYLMVQVREQLQNFVGSEYERRVNTKTSYYDDLKKRVQDYSSLLGYS